MKKIFTLFSAALFTSAAFAQIPNPSFETWYTVGSYDSAAFWSSANFAASALSVATCEKGTPGLTSTSGSYHMKLTSKTSLAGVIPGVATCGKIAISGTSYSVTAGFPWTTRSESLNGLWQYMPSGSDHVHVAILLTKWNTALSKRDTVAFTDSAISGMQMTTAQFAVALDYKSGKFPDTGLIVLGSSDLTGAVAGSYLYVDSLSFYGSVPSAVATVNNAANATVIYPNPASGNANIFCHRNTATDINIAIIDLGGRTIKEFSAKAARGENNIPVDLSHIALGEYIIRISDSEGTENKKLIVE